MNPAVIATLASGSYLERSEPVVLLGDSGTGKSHLLIGLGMKACEMGKTVRYVTCAQLVNELAEAADQKRLSRLIARYGRIDLLLLDELATNLPFSEWGKIVPDARLVAAIIDRLTFHAHIIETGSDSYRLRTTKAKRTR